RARQPPPPTLFPYTTLFRSNPSTSLVPVVAYDSPQGCRDSVAFYFYNIPPGTLSVTSNPLTCAGTTTGSAVFSFTPSFPPSFSRSEEHTSELQSRENLVCRL